MAAKRARSAAEEGGDSEYSSHVSSAFPLMRALDSLVVPPSRLSPEFLEAQNVPPEAVALATPAYVDTLVRPVWEVVMTRVPGLTAFEAEALVQYLVPEQNADGTCAAFGKLMPIPFRLHVEVYGRPKSPVDPKDALVSRLWRLKEIAQRYARVVQADWLGIYRVVRLTGSDSPTLVKEAYVGEHSRALFPLTPEFAKKSNNSTVAMHNKIHVIQDTWDIDADAPYYVCSQRVRSECCAPIRDRDGRVIGIVDAEAWSAAHFTPARILDVLQLCDDLGQLELLVPALE